MKKYFLIPFALFIFIAKAQVKSNECFGEEREINLGTSTPYAKVKIQNFEGWFLVDFGTTSSTIDPNNFINGKPVPFAGTANNFKNFNFFLDYDSVTLNVQNHSNIKGLQNFKQAGIIGTDFLSLNIITIDYQNKKIYRSNKANFCSNDFLLKSGFKATSSTGYYSNDLVKLNNKCVANIPTIQIKIGNISALAQIDTGFDDSKFRHSLNINQAFFDSLKDAGIILIENPSANLTLTTCIGNEMEPVLAFRLPPNVSFSVTDINGMPILVHSDINIFLKQTPLSAKSCGGIGTWQIPAAQLGSSFLYDTKKVIFDPFDSKIWFYTK